MSHGIGFGLQGIRFAWEPISLQGLPCLANGISLTPLGCDFVHSFRSAILISRCPKPIRWYLVSNSFLTFFISVRDKTESLSLVCSWTQWKLNIMNHAPKYSLTFFFRCSRIQHPPQNFFLEGNYESKALALLRLITLSSSLCFLTWSTFSMAALFLKSTKAKTLESPVSGWVLRVKSMISPNWVKFGE